MANQQQFEQAIQDNPDDWGRCLIFSDWLEEHGQKELAYAYRWMGYRRKRPDASQMDNDGAETFGLEPGTPIWIWWSISDTREDGPHDISSVLITLMEDPQDLGRSPGRLLDTELQAVFFPTYVGAVQALADALECIRVLYGLDAT